jgi:tight adherence protein B
MMGQATFFGLCIGISLTILFAVAPAVFREQLDRVARRRSEHYALELDALRDFEQNPVYYFVMEVCCAFTAALVLYLLFDALVFVVIGLLIGFTVPGTILRRRIRARKIKFEQQLPDALVSISSSVRAGLSLAQAMQQATDKMPAPVSQEFALISRQYNTGVSLDQALRRSRDRLNSKSFNLIASALLIARERGGEITQTLESIAYSLREINRLEEKIRTETAGPRFEAQVMMLVPPAILFVFSIVQPDLVDKMFHSSIGITMLLFATALMIIAHYWIQKITNEDI